MGWLSLEGIQRNLWMHHQVWVLPLIICFVSISFETVLFDGQQTWLGGNPSCSSWMFHQLPCWPPECLFSSFPDQSPPHWKDGDDPGRNIPTCSVLLTRLWPCGIRLPHPSPGSYISFKKIRVKSSLVKGNMLIHSTPLAFLLRDWWRAGLPPIPQVQKAPVRNDRRSVGTWCWDKG